MERRLEFNPRSVSEPCRELTDTGEQRPSRMSGVDYGTGKMTVTGLSGCSGMRDR